MKRYRTIVSKLGHKDPFIRKEAAKALARLGARAKAAIPLLIKALEDPDAKVRRHVSIALHAMGKAAVKPLSRAASTRECSYRLVIANILLHLTYWHASAAGAVVQVARACGSVFRARLIRHISRLARSNESNFEPIVKELYKEMISAISRNDVGLSRAALRIISSYEFITDKQAIMVAHAAMRSTDQKIGESAAIALESVCRRAKKSRLGPVVSCCTKVVLPDLIRLFRSKDHRMRVRALCALTSPDLWGRDTLRTILMRAIKDQSSEIRVLAVYGLNSFSKEEAVKEALKRALKDPSALVRGKAKAVLAGGHDLH